MERTDEVQRLAEHGCSVLCLGCPEGMLFGIDYSAWSVGPQFMGVSCWQFLQTMQTTNSVPAA